MKEKSILVTGANGQVGRELQDLAARYPELRFRFFAREQLDISDKEAVAAAFENEDTEVCINCAAYTAVDKAEIEPEAAFRINETGTRNLAAAAAASNSRFLHISTDYVFNGKGTTPYTEELPVDPQNVYGASKWMGEQAALQESPDAVIVRTSWVYSAYGANFVKTMLRLMSTRDSLNVVADQQGSPTYAADLAAALLQIAMAAEWKGGIYHYSNSGITTWFDFAKAIAIYTGAACEVHPIPTSAYPTPASRPLYSVMDTTKIQTAFGLSISGWKESLAICLERLKAEGV